MTDLRKAAEMALEALTRAHPISNSGKHLYAHSEAMAALSQALAESANSTTGFVEPKVSSQTEQEPVAWVIEGGEVDYYVDVVAKIKPGTPLYTAPPKQEWDGPTDEEYENFCSLIQREEAKLKEKNT
jgi:hypothetical protein